MEYSYKTSGFLKDIAYTSELSDLLNQYSDKFGSQLERIELELKEVPYQLLEYTELETIEFPKDGKNCKLQIIFYKSCNRNGKITGVPTVNDVRRKIRTVINRAFKQYKKIELDNK